VASSGKAKVKRALVLSGGAGRGAFQVGVLRYLQQRRWRPDLVCGSSIGAIHAAAIGAGMTVDHLERLWRTVPQERLETFHPGRMLRRLFSRETPFSLSDAISVRKILQREIDFHRLRDSDTAVAIAAVDLTTASTVYFTNEEITADHVAASAAAPIFSPWQFAAGRPYFDGGLMANTPILPALARGAEEIVVVLLSPASTAGRPLPRSMLRISETAFELMLAGPFQAVLDGYEAAGGRLPKIRIVAPPRMLGFASLGNYSARQVKRLIGEGYRSAKKAMDAGSLMLDPEE
jgi:NTE family protein